MSARRKRWDIRPVAPAEFVHQLGCGPLLANLLYQRDLRDPAAAQAFLDADYQRSLNDPLLLKGMSEAAPRLAHAVREREPIAIYGDFDTDGVTAVTLLTQALGAMGADVRPYVPHRTREGYGLNNLAVEHLAADGVRLLVTVDCGVSNIAEVAAAQARGVDVIVTDHHTPPAELPPALALVNPKQPGCLYPDKQLVGVGIAFKLIQALARYGLRPGNLRGRDLLDVVALGTVADMGLLIGENRALVKAGLQAINTTTRPGLQALITVAGLVPGKIDSTAIGYMLGPRLNAAGRLDDARRAYQLLLAADAQEARTIAQELHETNRARQELTRLTQEKARVLAAAADLQDDPILILADEAFPAGVIGLVASRLVDELGRPVVIIERGPEHSRGSARSIPGFNMVEALNACGELFVRHGGHAAAAGFTITSPRIPELHIALNRIAAARMQGVSLEPLLPIDATVPLTDVCWELLNEINRLEPFGNGNPQPVLMSAGVRVLDARTRGAENQHLKLLLQQGAGPPHEAIAFRMGHLAPALRRHPHIDLAYVLEANEWNGERRLQINVKDLRRATI